jgi:AraC-like DNA-binding protein
LFNFPLSEITNSYFSSDEIFGPVGSQLHNQIADIPLVDGKIALLENFLIQRLYSSSREDRPMDYALKQIVSKHGLLTIRDLYTELGYSKRHFDRKFKSYAGISPKELATIKRFHTFYQRGWQDDVEQIEDLHQFYYDQSHFIKEFRKFTGTSPTTYFRQTGRFAKVFYM